MTDTQVPRNKQFENSIAYHKITPEHDDVKMDMQKLREAALEFGNVIIARTEYSREQSLALTHVEEALMWATKQIAITRLPVAEPIK